MLGGWQEQFILMLISEDGVCIMYMFDGVFEEVNNFEKVLNNLKVGLVKLGQMFYYVCDMQVILLVVLFVLNSLFNQFCWEVIDMFDVVWLVYY